MLENKFQFTRQFLKLSFYNHWFNYSWNLTLCW